MSKQFRIIIISLINILLLIILILPVNIKADQLNYYHTYGNKILDSNGQPAVFNGNTWFGFETSNFAPHGLWIRSMDSMLDQMKSLGYNLLRIPYTNEMFLPGKMPSGIDYTLNPDLQGLMPVQVLDKLIEKCKARGIKIILDRHRPTSSGQSELWYTNTVSEQQWIDDWKMLVQRYNGNDTVIGADLDNEPHGSATWGTGDIRTDWRLAAERAGNEILSVNPNWLIIVEGIENYNGDYYWWGGNLKGVKNYPVNLNISNRLVYSTHDYGPDEYSQLWFNDPIFPNNMPNIWYSHWEYISDSGIAPVLIGEFGGKSVDNTSKEGIWQNTLVDYISQKNLYWAYWCWNPNSNDTGGVLNDNWMTINELKQQMLNRIMR